MFKKEEWRLEATENNPSNFTQTETMIDGKPIISLKKVCPKKNNVEIELNKLVPFDGYPLYQFKDQRLADMVENIKNNGVVRPIFVRPSYDGKYEILNGHYRVAAATELKLNTIPAVIIEGLTNEQALLYVSETSPLGLLVKHGVDVHDVDYKDSENYKRIENSRVFSDDNFSMALDEYVERLLLTERDVYDTYESPYAMGNPYVLDEDECGVVELSLDIIRVMNLTNEKAKEAKVRAAALRTAAKNETDTKTAEVKKKRATEATEFSNNLEKEQAADFSDKFTRPGGYVEQLKKYLDLDLDSFDDNDLRNRREKVKILYFFYMLRERDFPRVKVLHLLSKPSMESVDNSFLGRETSNGRFIKLIKHSLEMELSAIKQPYGNDFINAGNSKDNIKGAIAHVVDTWGSFIDDARIYMDYLSGYGCECDFDGIISALKSTPKEQSESKKAALLKIDPLSPIETLYLKVAQHEYLGQVKDILMVHNLQTSVEYNVPPEYIAQMRMFYAGKIRINDIEKFFTKESVREIAKYVYLKPEVSTDERKAIRESKDKFLRLLNFCSLAELYTNADENIPKLLIISCLQAIFLDGKEIFDYTFHGFESTKGSNKGRIYVQAALKNDKRTYDALQVYWVRKVVDRWYANIGRYDLKYKLRELEKACLSILERILSCSKIDEMIEMNSSYYSRLSEWKP